MLLDYYCKKCGINFERIIKYSDKKKYQKCDFCTTKCKPLETQIPASPQFKGSGFYSTDYK